MDVNYLVSMRQNRGDFRMEFIVGKSYQVELQENEYPILDAEGNDTGESEVIKDKDKFFLVLEHLSGDHENYMRVFNLKLNKEHLFYTPSATKQTEIDRKQGHSKQKKDYKTPTVPNGFHQVCAFYYPDGGIVLDFVNHERKDFATESIEVNIEWPWIEGYRPTKDDWENIGFSPLYA